MSTVERSETRRLPPLVAGQSLDRSTFHERYQAMPAGIRAELVGGVVFMPSPLGYRHGKSDSDISDWLGVYKNRTQGVKKSLNASTQFDEFGEVQPDILLRIPEALGGTSRIVGGYIVGPPELVVEVSLSTRSYDLGPKKADYQRAGVKEYLFVGLEPEEVHWFILRDGQYEELMPDVGGVIRSEVFPGLWLDSVALFAEDTEALIATLELGLTSPEHGAFLVRLNPPTT